MIACKVMLEPPNICVYHTHTLGDNQEDCFPTQTNNHYGRVGQVIIVPRQSFHATFYDDICKQDLIIRANLPISLCI